MRKLPQAILFDLDGTLVDSVPDLAIAVDNMLAERGSRIAGQQRVRGWVGNGARVLVQRAIAWSEAKPMDQLTDSNIDSALILFNQHYTQSLNRASKLYPGVLDFLAYVAEQSIPMALVTNKPIAFVPGLLSQFKLAKYFSVVLGGDSVAQGKPHPQMLLQACQMLKVEPDKALMIGDSCNDIKAARAAAMPVVGLTYGYNHGRPIADDKPDKVVDHLMRIADDWESK